MADKHEIEFEGQKFELQSGAMNELVLSEFFSVMSAGEDQEVPHDTMLALLEASVVAKDWARFKKLGRRTDNFWDKAVKVIEARMAGPVEEETGHPTGQPSVSTDGPEPTVLKSVSNSDAKILQLSHGRPDRYAMLKQAQETAAARSA